MKDYIKTQKQLKISDKPLLQMVSGEKKGEKCREWPCPESHRIISYGNKVNTDLMNRRNVY